MTGLLRRKKQATGAVRGTTKDKQWKKVQEGGSFISAANRVVFVEKIDSKQEVSDITGQSLDKMLISNSKWPTLQHRTKKNDNLNIIQCIDLKRVFYTSDQRRYPYKNFPYKVVKNNPVQSRNCNKPFVSYFSGRNIHVTNSHSFALRF